MNLLVKKVGDCHKLPKQALVGQRGDVGYDIVADVITVKLHDTTKVNVTTLEHFSLLLSKGDVVYIEYAPNYVLQLDDPNYHLELCANSRISDSMLTLANGIGVIDPGYTGVPKLRYYPLFKLEVLCTRINEGAVALDALKDIVPFIGDVCGQAVIRRSYHADIKVVTELNQTERGAGGFGSTKQQTNN